MDIHLTIENEGKNFQFLRSEQNIEEFESQPKQQRQPIFQLDQIIETFKLI